VTSQAPRAVPGAGPAPRALAADGPFYGKAPDGVWYVLADGEWVPSVPPGPPPPGSAIVTLDQAPDGS
jgi:hypothetical protein